MHTCIQARALGTHVYPKIEAAGGGNTCWITFLGAHGHCEAHNDKFDLYNTDDTPEGYAKGSGASQEACLARADWWMKYCDTPVIATFVPDGLSSTWQADWIMHDSHGGRMFEETESAMNHINPDSLNPHSPINPSEYKSEFKSMDPKSPDYHDSPEYRKSLHLQGEEKEALLGELRARLGMAGTAATVSQDVLQHGGVDTGKETAETNSAFSYSETKTSEYQNSSSYGGTSTSYETSTGYETSTAYESSPSYESTTIPYETTELSYETTSYEAPVTEGEYEEPPTYTEPPPVYEHSLEDSHNPTLINFKK